MHHATDERIIGRIGRFFNPSAVMAQIPEMSLPT